MRIDRLSGVLQHPKQPPPPPNPPLLSTYLHCSVCNAKPHPLKCINRSPFMSLAVKLPQHPPLYSVVRKSNIVSDLRNANSLELTKYYLVNCHMYIAQLPYQAATRPGVQVKRLAAIHELLHALRKYLLSHMTL